MLTRMLHYSMNVRGMMSISSYVHMIIVVEIEGEDGHSKVLVLFKGALLMQLPGRCKLCLKTKAHCQNTKSLGLISCENETRTIYL